MASDDQFVLLQDTLWRVLETPDAIPAVRLSIGSIEIIAQILKSVAEQRFAAVEPQLMRDVARARYAIHRVIQDIDFGQPRRTWYYDSS